MKVSFTGDYNLPDKEGLHRKGLGKMGKGEN